MENFSLELLEAYAKTLTKKQVNMLYESKLNKKYKKKLFEGMKYQNDDSYSLFLDNYTLNEHNLTSKKTIARYVSQYGLEFNITNEGIYLYTPNIVQYHLLTERMMTQDGFNKDTIKEISNYPDMFEK